MSILVMLGVLAAGFAAILRGRRPAWRRRPVAVRPVSAAARAAPGCDATLGLRDPVRSL